MENSPLLLEIQTGKHRGRRLRLLKAEILVGRGEEATIRIASTEVSREHCRLVPEGAGIRVIDLKSRNGTFVDGRPVDGERFLLPGGMLTVGPLTFLLVGNEEPTTRHPVKVALKGKTGTSDQLSEDKIVDWLSDYELPVTPANASNETSIMRKSAASTPPSGSAPTPPRPVASPAASLRKSAPVPGTKSVRDEAREIIRRHFESVGRRPGGK